jgi:small subunit ribosomal protein S20
VANIKSAKKRILIGTRNSIRNKSIKSAIKTIFKKAEDAIKGNSAEKDSIVKSAIKTIDTAARKGIVHKNSAARKKSRLMDKSNKVVAETPKPKKKTTAKKTTAKKAETPASEK